MGNTVRVNVKRIKGKPSAQQMDTIMRIALNSDTMHEIGMELHRMTTKNLKQGIITDGNVIAKLPPLSKDWIDRRKKLAAVNPTAEWFSPRRSNLTFTGQLIKSLFFDVRGTTVTLKFGDSVRTPYTNLNGTTGKQRLTNRKLSLYLTERHGSLIGLTEQMRDRVIKIVQKRLRAILRVLR